MTRLRKVFGLLVCSSLSWATLAHADAVLDWNLHADTAVFGQNGPRVGSFDAGFGTGYLAHATGWVWYFLICMSAAVPGFLLLAYLQRRGHFATLAQQPAA